MANLNEIYPSFYNVLAYPPANFDNDPSSWEVYKKNQKELNDKWNDYDSNFLPDPVMDTINSLVNIYKDTPGSYVQFAQMAIRDAFLVLPGGQTAAWAINKVLGLIFPSHEKSLFDQIMEAVKEMVEADFKNLALNQIQAVIEGFRSPLGHFSDSIQLALGKPTFPTSFPPSGVSIIMPSNSTDCSKDSDCNCSNSAPNSDSNAAPCTPCSCRISNVYQEFTNTRDIIEAALPGLLNPLNNILNGTSMADYMKMGLPLYVIAASLNLALHKNYIAFAQKWDYDPAGTNVIVRNLRDRIIEYSNNVYTIFTKYLPPLTDNSKSGLNAYIRYTRNITLNALDTVAGWPMMNTNDYPIGTNVKFTRILFNDIVGPVEYYKGSPTRDDSSLHFNLYDLNKKQLPNNSISDYFYNGMQLSSLKFQTFYHSYKECYPLGLDASYDANNGVPIRQLQSNSRGTSWSNNLFEDWPLLSSLNMASTQGGYDVANIIAEGDTISSGCDGDPRTISHNPAYVNQRIQAIYPVQPTNPSSYPGYGSTDKIGLITTLIPNDTTYLIDLNPEEISTFPAELSYDTNGTTLIEYMNGAAALQLMPNQYAKYIISNYDMDTSSSQGVQVRVRAATTQDGGSLSITVNQQTQTLKLSNTTNTDYTQIVIKGKQGYYGLFPPTDSQNPKQRTSNIFQLPNSYNNTAIIQNNSQVPIILDRIEFVPV
ncbi:insecticidal delta-endotoxin Cry8Ea1 family protein, partial [Bacillus wiedmannii]|uniref:insecticidal delta-endotoxin Cry8Ea1 family protein n=1 Tax=Bacillus wiedmannii TaxID=1890302 RepID=UPI002E1CE333|nr:insecticidal delta-endotoxin Cry8Ea1 family protein [Bacillus wiedmannii]